MPDDVIRFEHVTKTYPVEGDDAAGFKDFLLRLPSRLRRRAPAGPFTALADLSLEVRRGECLGVIGRNGSGKSTTLGLIAGVLRPTAGSVRVSRRVSPLLELGAGFHPELSGEDNLVLNGVLLGLTRRDVLDRRDAIVAFAELEAFIDRPLRTYSAGMVARLGFSVVVHLSPEILLIDEVLAVGDEAFQGKCLRKMEEFRAAGTTMVFVSHDLASVERICDRVALLDAGRLAALAPPREAIAEYHARMNMPPSPNPAGDHEQHNGS